MLKIDGCMQCVDAKCCHGQAKAVSSFQDFYTRRREADALKLCIRHQIDYSKRTSVATPLQKLKKTLNQCTQ